MTKEAYDQVVGASHKAKLSHEVLAAAVSYQAMKAWNEHKEKNGETVNHAKAKEFMAAAGGAFLDHILETKGLDAIDKHRTKKLAEEYSGGYSESKKHHHHH